MCVNKNQNNCLVYEPIIIYTTNIKSVVCKYCAAGYYLRSDKAC